MMLTQFKGICNSDFNDGKVPDLENFLLVCSETVRSPAISPLSED